MALPVYYEIPIFLIVILLIVFIVLNLRVRSVISADHLKKVYLWLALSSFAFIFWAGLHMYFDFFPMTENLKLLEHYIISHGFLLIAVLFLVVAGKYINDFGKQFGFGAEKVIEQVKNSKKKK